VDLLVDALGSAGAQDPAAEDAGLDLQIGGFDLPSPVVDLDEFAGGVAARIEQGGDQPVTAGVGAVGGGDGDLGVDDPHAQGADGR
jgi:hypothetical protein